MHSNCDSKPALSSDKRAAAYNDLLVLAGPRAAVLVDGEGRVERLVHRERPEIDFDHPLDFPADEPDTIVDAPAEAW